MKKSNNNRTTLVRVLFSREMAVIVGLAAMMGALGNVEFKEETAQDKTQKAGAAAANQVIENQNADSLVTVCTPVVPVPTP